MLGNLQQSWPYVTQLVGQRLARIKWAFQAKQCFLDCIGAFDGSHIYINALQNTIVVVDLQNRIISFSILLQGVVDAKCYFMSINTGVSGCVHDIAHFKSMKLYRKSKERVMIGFNEDPITLHAPLPLSSYMIADRGYPFIEGASLHSR